MKLRFELMAAVLVTALVAPATAAAMCGCMMPIDDTGIPETTTLTSEATQVVLMRYEDVTIQTMQNRYEGPLENFALIIPTPEILSEEKVKTLNPEVFDRIDRATAPTLTEYWQHDPCEQVNGFNNVDLAAEGAGDDNNIRDNQPPSTRDPGVVVEAEFAVGEYNIQILGAEDGILLEEWLVDNGYRVPQGASKYLQPYIDSGMYFFVAKVDASKVNFVDDQAVLSPLRFHYETPDFSLPTRLGMMNSSGRQDLIVYTLGDSRYEAANVPNATIPTNVPLLSAVKADFPRFYDELLEKTLESYGTKTAITEFAGPSWMIQQDLMSLGGDAITEIYPNAPVFNSTLSRLHFRYEKDSVGEDLVFAEAPGIIGGQETWNDRGVDPTNMEQGSQPSEGWNNFRAHYLIKHYWNGKVDCENPAYGRWGGDPNAEGNGQPETISALSPNTTGEEVFKLKKLGKSPTPIAQIIEADIPQIGLEREYGQKSSAGGCSSANAGDAIPAGLLLVGLGLLGIRRRIA